MLGLAPMLRDATADRAVVLVGSCLRRQKALAMLRGAAPFTALKPFPLASSPGVDARLADIAEDVELRAPNAAADVLCGDRRASFPQNHVDPVEPRATERVFGDSR